MRLTTILLVLMGMDAATGGGSGEAPDAGARAFHTRALVVDAHADTAQRMVFQGFDLAARDARGHVDIPRMREGGLDAVFFSIWVPSRVTGPEAVKRALRQIDAVREQVRRHPADLMLATTASQVREAASRGRIAALMGMEGAT
jgi:membrane dipeptidase